ncbi:MAG: hypothetical protein ACM3PP_06120 [Candidatus Saccharibacteria bacterium]
MRRYCKLIYIVLPVLLVLSAVCTDIAAAKTKKTTPKVSSKAANTVKLPLPGLKINKMNPTFALSVVRLGSKDVWACYVSPGRELRYNVVFGPGGKQYMFATGNGFTGSKTGDSRYIVFPRSCIYPTKAAAVADYPRAFKSPEPDYGLGYYVIGLIPTNNIIEANPHILPIKKMDPNKYPLHYPGIIVIGE